MPAVFDVNFLMCQVLTWILICRGSFSNQRCIIWYVRNTFKEHSIEKNRTQIAGLLFNVTFLTLTDLCQLFSVSFACILFPGFQGVFVCVSAKAGVLLFFCSSRYDLITRLPKLWIKFGICLDFKANHYQFSLLSL